MADELHKQIMSQILAAKAANPDLDVLTTPSALSAAAFAMRFDWRLNEDGIAVSRSGASLLDELPFYRERLPNVFIKAKDAAPAKPLRTRRARTRLEIASELLDTANAQAEEGRIAGLKSGRTGGSSDE